MIDSLNLNFLSGVICANHLSPNDVHVMFADIPLNRDYLYLVTGQKHSGVIGALEKLIDKMCPSLWLERSDPESRRQFSVDVLKAARKSGPVILFPEGYCTNNSQVLQFRKAVFQKDIIVYPESRYGDSYWKENYFFMYLLRVLTSWAIVYNVHYLAPQKCRPLEPPIEFAARIQRIIASRVGVRAAPKLERWKAKAEWQRRCATELGKCIDQKFYSSTFKFCVMPSVLSRLRGNLRDAAPALLGTGLVFAIIHLYRRHYQLGRFTAIKSFSARSDSKSERAHVDFNFILRLFRILRVLIPSPFCFEVLLMVLIALSLLLRTYADVWMIQTSTGIEASIIARKRRNFIKSTMHYLMCMPLVSVVNSFLRFALSELKLRFRERLTHNFYKQYLNGFTFYKMANLDNRISNADQLLTQDVDRFCGGVVDLYSNLSKPLVDVMLYVSKIGDSLGWQAPFRLFFYLIASGLVLTYLRRPIGRMTVMEQQFEGDYRSINSRLIVNSEEIAFYRGNERERRSIMNSFQKMISHLRSLILFRFSISFLDNIVAKYVATVGWYTMSRPFFNQNNSTLKQKNKTELMQDYYSSGRMMFKLAEALGRLALAGREMTRLAGFTSRVDMLLNVLNDLENGKYQRTMILDMNNTNQTRQGNSGEINGKINGLLLSASSSLSSPSTDEDDLVTFQPGAGKIEIRDNLIRFKRVPLVTPNGDILIKCLDFEVPSGTNVLVCGPNGCGKSSLFRILGELWPLWGGKLIKPEKGKLFYVPQRPYMTIGTLRDQVIYPDRPADARRKSFTDNDLEELLENMSRLFYHRPQFAILDECTSAVSADVEDNIYRRCHELGITLFTVSHRKSLWKHHDYSLHMDGRGFYEFKKINHEDPNTQFGS
uniref:Uncharacterized protein n=1 Tax=Meloidogyne floridensis TaxID=298350 RepID=A0A915NYE4_9BILA